MIPLSDAAAMAGVEMIGTPEHDASVREMTADNLASLQAMADHLARSGWPGFAERATRAGNRLGSITQSYFDACADNDRLRAEAARLRAAIEAEIACLMASEVGGRVEKARAAARLRRILNPETHDHGV